MDGSFSLDNVEEGSILVISYTGYEPIEVAAADNLQVELAEFATLDEIVVTGVFDARTRMEASVAISTLDAKEIQMQAPGSGADLLKNMPGVFVNSVYGEIRNVVYSRGISAGSLEPSSGYYYVSLQEDGLPVTNLLYRNFVPDQFFRPDVTIARVEGIRGGSASITSANAPGGIFNYISKTGGEKFEGTVATRLGLEGNGQNPYYRGEFNFGGPLNADKSLRYNVGGFYRYSYGAHDPGYAQNNGGQLKANIVKFYENGSIKLYGKYLNDRTGQNEFIPSQNFDDPMPVDGFDNTSSVYVGELSQPFRINSDPSDERTHETTKGSFNRNSYIGLEWNHDFGNGFTLTNNARYNVANANWNGTIVVSPMAVDFWLSHAIMGTMGPQGFGTLTYTDHQTGKVLGRVSQEFDPTQMGPPFKFTLLESNFPGSNVAPNSVFFQPLANSFEKNTEFINQLSLSKSWNKTSITVGGYFASSSLDFTQFGDAGVVIGTIENQPHRVDVTLEGLDGNTYEFTNENGVMKLGGVGRNMHEATQTNYAFFFGHNWEITDKINLDWGGRYEYNGMNGTYFSTVPNDPLATNGGYDGNFLTMYDNFDGTLSGDELDFDDGLGTFSYSVGLNYKANNSLAFYGRFSNGKKAPNATYYLEKVSQEEFDNIPLVEQTIIQIEGGVKIKKPGFTLYATPFYSILDDVNETTVGQEIDGTGYFLTDILNKYTTIGLELETNIDIAKNFSVRAIGTIQTAEATEYATYSLGVNGKDDDMKIDFSGNELDNNPNLMLSITPTYDNGKLLAGLNLYHMGARWANAANAFELPAYTTLNLILGYQISDNVRLGVNVTNLTNTYGVMGWTAPGVFPANLDRAGFTAERITADPNATFGSLAIPARAYFLTASYDF